MCWNYSWNQSKQQHWNIVLGHQARTVYVKMDEQHLQMSIIWCIHDDLCSWLGPWYVIPLSMLFAPAEVLVWSPCFISSWFICCKFPLKSQNFSHCKCSSLFLFHFCWAIVHLDGNNLVALGMHLRTKQSRINPPLMHFYHVKSILQNTTVIILTTSLERPWMSIFFSLEYQNLDCSLPLYVLFLNIKRVER